MKAARRRLGGRSGGSRRGKPRRGSFEALEPRWLLAGPDPHLEFLQESAVYGSFSQADPQSDPAIFLYSDYSSRIPELPMHSTDCREIGLTSREEPTRLATGGSPNHQVINSKTSCGDAGRRTQTGISSWRGILPAMVTRISPA